MRAASHGSFQAEYMLGKMFLEAGEKDKAREWFEKSAETDAWTQTRVGLLLYYDYGDTEKGKQYLLLAIEQGYAPAEQALRSIERNENAKIVTGVCNLFYYASKIIDNRTEDMYDKEHQVNYHGIDRKQRKALREKKQAHGLAMG